jgi:hypothetical protein
VPAAARRLQNAQAVRTRKMQVGQDQTELAGARLMSETAPGEQLDLRLVVDDEDFEPFAG